MAENNGLTGLEIAVIGMSGRFPGARNIDEFWENLKNGVESVRFYSDEELLEAGVDPTLLENPNYVKSGGGELQDFEYFDAAFFGYSPNEAIVMDPQARIFHECVWEALEQAGYDPGSYKGKIGLYAGASSSTSWENLTVFSGKADEVGRYAAGSLASSDYLCTRIAYKLNLKGPVYAVQSACSTSLAAIDMACRGILTGLCNMALAGGVSVKGLREMRGYLFKEGMIRSPDGHCRAFDAEAKGTASGEGAGVVVLKLLEEALADRDTIHAIIKGSASNNDGNRKVGYTAPSIEGQAEVIRSAHLSAEINPESITYVETHGTGTSLGDPVEIEALKQGFGTNKKRFCFIGSLKTNIGHLDTAAGVAGFIKTVLALEHQLIPPSLHFETPNPKIDFENSPFIVNTTLKEWKKGNSPRRAGVNSFGIGGTNAHVVLEEFEENASGGQEPFYKKVPGLPKISHYYLLVLSAKTPSALDKMTVNLAIHLKNNPPVNLDNVSYTLQVGRKPFRYRRILVCGNIARTVETLTNPGSPGMLSFQANEKSPSVFFLFPGQGSQYVDMGLGLYQEEPMFRQEMDRCFEILKPITGYDIKTIIYPSHVDNRSDGSYNTNIINQTEITQPVIFSIEYALAKLLMSWGIKPNAMIGHSIGEYTAACLAGVFSLENALKIVVLRGKLMQQVPPGAMTGVSISEEQLQSLLKANPALSPAAINSPSNCTVSGTRQAVEDFEHQAKEKGYRVRPLHTSHAFHSDMMNPILKPFEEAFKQIVLNKPGIPYLSNITGDWITTEQPLDPTYWSNHLRKTVRFSDGVKELLKRENNIFIEVGPGRVLSTFVKEHDPGKSGSQTINLVRHPQEDISDVYFLYREIGKLWLYGKEIDWQAFHHGEPRRRTPLPTYPFERQSYWIEKSTGKAPGQPGSFADRFYLPQWKRTPPVYKNQTTAPTRVDADSEKNRWLIFMDRVGLGGLLIKRLEARGDEVITVIAGETVQPESTADYLQLFQSLTAAGKMPSRILHLWTLSGPYSSVEENSFERHFEETQILGFYSLLNIAKAIRQIATGSGQRFRLYVISNHWHDVSGEEEIDPAKATMAGPLAVIPQEHPNIRCRGIDVVFSTDNRPGIHQENLVERIIEETLNDSGGGTTAFRGPYRLIREFEPLHLSGVKREQLPLKEKGVYLITGGLGKIGLMLAEFLAREYKARLILTGRSAGQNKERAKKAAELEALGAEVMIFSADVGDRDRMLEAAAAARKRWGEIHGVIHGAGVAKGPTFCTVDNLQPGDCQLQFRPKVYGTRVLEELFWDKNLDFCILISSISVILGGLQFAAYAGANAFMDAFVSHMKRRGNGQWFSVNWDGMPPRETIEAFKRIFALPASRVSSLAVSNIGNLQARIDRWINLESTEEKEKTAAAGAGTGGQHPRPQLFTPFAAPINKTQETIAGTWQRIFGFDRIGIRDDFLELGGDSLKAVTAIAAIHKELNVEIPLPVFFSSPTVEKLAEYLESTGAANENSYSAITPMEKKEYYALSPAQKRLYFVQQIDKESTAYNEVQAVELENLSDIRKLENVFNRLIERHECYRTSIIEVEGKPMQRIHPAGGSMFKIEYYQAVELEPILREFVRPFDLSSPPLIRAALIDAGGRWILAMDKHHIVTDGVSHQIFLKEIAALYAGKELATPRLQYKDYAEWQNSPLQQAALEKQQFYWLGQFQDEIPVLNLPLDFPRPAIQSFAGGASNFEIGIEATKAIKELAIKEETTLYAALLTCFNILLAKLSGQEDIVIGTPTAGRRHGDLEQIMGMFVNTLALRNFPGGRKTFADFLREVKENTLNAFDNQDYPFEELVESVSVKRDMSRNPLFDVVFVLQNVEAVRMVVSGCDLNIKPYRYKNKNAKFDLALQAVEANGKLLFIFEYCTKLFMAETIQRFDGYFKRIVLTILENPGGKIADIEITSEEEKRKILFDFNNTAAAYPNDKTIHQLFEEQAARMPDYAGLVGPVRQTAITYRQLNEQSNQLAAVLIEKGVLEGSIVGIMGERTIEMIIGMLGILKSGCAYLPIDPVYPGERIDYMLADSNAKILLGVEECQKKIIVNCQLLIVNCKLLKGCPRRGLHHSNQLAYIIYTSGTTGKPKGVMIEHMSLVNFVFSMYRDYQEDFSPKDKCLSLTNFCFDVSVCEIFMPLVFGASIVLAAYERVLDPWAMAGAVVKNSVTFTYIPPGLLWEVYEYLKVELERSGGGLWLNKMLVGVEPIKDNVLEAYLKLNPTMKIINGYGPTEATICASAFRYESHESEGKRVPIGRPLANMVVILLDKYLHLAPVGVPGELYIGGVGVARGYLNNPELTADSFNRSYRAYKTYINYKTGDLARWLVDGNIEFLGRIDHQVKVRGFRIELGEIESVLQKHEAVRAAVVTVHEGGFLCAYFTADREVPVSQLKEYLASSLPDYMIPSYFVQLGKMPLTSNGKVDRNALTVPGLISEKDYTAPSGEFENKLTVIWSEILGIKEDVISVNAGFFDLGGHSLKATRMVSMIHRTFGVKIPLVEIFKSPTVRGLANYIKGMTRRDYSAIEPVEEKEYYCLSSAQKRLFVLQQMEPESVNYNITQVIPLAGEIDLRKLEFVFRKLIARHESLRTSFEMIDNEPVQRIWDEVEFEIEYFATDEHGQTRTFDLSCAPLLRVGFIEESGRGPILVVDMHHIITDGVSQWVLKEEFEELYKGLGLPPLKLQYKDYSQWQNSEEHRASVKQQETFWLKDFSGELPALHLPIDFPRPPVQSFAGNTVGFLMETTGILALKKLASDAKASLFMVILAMYNVLLSKLSGQDDIIVGTPMAGRRHADLERIIGMFVNTLPIRNFPFGEKLFSVFLQEVKERALEVFDNQDYQFEDLVDKLSVPRDTGRNPVFDVMFNLLNQGDYTAAASAKVPGNPGEHKKGVAKFDLTLTVMELGECLSFTFEYCTRLFEPGTIDRIMVYFKRILELISLEPDLRIGELELITEQERTQILFEFNDTAAAYPNDKTIHQLFVEQASRMPDYVGLVGVVGPVGQVGPVRQITLTYRQINEQSNQLSAVLIEKGVLVDCIIGIMMNRSIEMLIGIFGILKAGGAYLPIDPEYPQERIDFMLKDSNARILLGMEEYRKKIIVNCQLLIVNCKLLIGCPRRGLHHSSFIIHHSNQLAYIIYTSGSTGKPKGVMIGHGSVVNILTDLSRQYPFGETDCFLMKTSFTFDVSVAELFGWFWGGGRLALLPPGAEKDPERIIDAIECFRVTHIDFVPSMFGVFMEVLKIRGIEKIFSLKYIFLAGEVLSPILVERFRELNSVIRLENLYGPTEGTVYASGYSLTDWAGSNNVPIGRPLQNVKLCILDRHGRLQPMGVTGELCIGGAGLARGYLNNPELTSQKFNRSYRSYKTYINYKTGDLARWLVDGNIEFLGRIDHQVKVRGFRIELGEIESVLLRYEGVRAAAATLNDGELLCAYFTADREVPAAQLRAYLAASLSEYMLPSYFVQIEKIPLNPNGKIDRKALPVPGFKVGDDSAPPRDEMEEKLAQIWAEILGIEKDIISIDADFFQVGGHSLKATRMLSMIHRAFEVKIPLVGIFKLKSIRELAKYITRAEKSTFDSIEPAEKREYYELSDNQTWLWGIYRQDPLNTAYNMPGGVAWTSRVNPALVEESLRKLMEKHETLRTGIIEIAGKPFQFILDSPGVPLKLMDISSLPEEEKLQKRKLIYEKEENTPFDLTRPPLFRVVLVKWADEGWDFIYNIHHIVSDGWSLQVLRKDFLSIHRALISGNDVPKTSVPTQYKDFTMWQLRQANDPLIRENSSRYWREKLSAGIPVVSLPVDFPGDENMQDRRGAGYRSMFGAELKIRLWETARQHNTTLFSVMASVFMFLLSDLSQREEIACILVNSGRRHASVYRGIGFFATPVPFISRVPKGEPFGEFLDRFHREALDVFQHIIFHPKHALERPDLENPDIPIVFNMLNMQEYTIKSELDLFSPIHISEGHEVKWDLEAYVSEYSNGIEIYWAYRKSVFKPETIAGIAERFSEFLEYFTANPAVSLNSFPTNKKNEIQT